MSSRQTCLTRGLSNLHDEAVKRSRCNLVASRGHSDLAEALRPTKSLQEVLPSPAMMAQGRLLCIQNHLAMVCDSLWAINSMMIIPKMRVLYNMYLQSKKLDGVLDVPIEFADWETDVAASVTDAGELLGRILDWEASLHRYIVGNPQQVHFRHVILVELKEMLCCLNSLVLRGSAMGLRRDPMSSMNPLREDYSIVLNNEVVGRQEDIEKLIVIFQQYQPVPSNNNGNDSDPFVIVIVGKEGVGKATLARMIYHHTWVCKQFHHRIWVDVPRLSPFKIVNIIRKEFARSINNEEYCDLHRELPLHAFWEYINEQLDGRRYLLVLHFEYLASLTQQEWNELKNILLPVGGPGSGVLIINRSSTQSVSDMGFLHTVKNIRTYCLNPLSEDAWLELFKRHAATTIPSKQDKSEIDELIPFTKQHFQNLIHQPLLAKIVGWLNHDVQTTFPSPLPAALEEFYMLRNLQLVNIRVLQYRILLSGIQNEYNAILRVLTTEYLIPTEMAGLGWIESHYTTQEVLEFMIPRMVYYLRTKVPKDSTTIPRCCRYLRLEINPRATLFRLPIVPIEVSRKLISLILQEDETATQEYDEEEITLQAYKKRRMKAATAILKFLNNMLVRLVHLRILIVETSIIQTLPNEVSMLVNLRYLHLSKLKMELLPKSLFDLHNLRVLSLICCKKLQKIPERIYKLEKLEVLSLAYCTKLQQLPKSITRLQNLLQLDMEGCCWLRKLPEDLFRFKSLRVLHVTGCASLSQIPLGIEQLFGLRSLVVILAGVDGCFGLAELQALTNLQQLTLQNLERVKETQTEMLMGQQRLRILSLRWGGEEANDSSESATPLQLRSDSSISGGVLHYHHLVNFPVS
ncbi:putative disease resistance protein RGA3 [Zingiber officinale]|uniref:putative disease resistance protein RGA3 n=1 Tax=Zingiber officinale TaxID=94328 RepID=UPI001C4BF64D|nr:putative disease resistance protein RGA3 [Zingiber officinale]